MYNHIMLDIETLGDESYSVITSIGAVLFDINTGEITGNFHKYISADSAVASGLKINPSTVMWWLKQSDAARSALTKGNENGVYLSTALAEFSDWLKLTSPNPSKLYIWGRGPRFDMGILADAYRAINMSIPWNTRNELCVRTMEFLHPTAKLLTPNVDTGHGSEGMGTHDAIYDCEFQIKYVSRIFESINFRKLLKTQQ